MTHDITAIRPAAEVDLQEYVQTLNAAYADYFVPIYLTPQSFRNLVERESIRLEASQAALYGGEVVGTGLLGVRGRRGWIGGLGVVPAHRRCGLGRRLMEALLDAGRALGLESVQLEVITRNAPAKALYDALGFETRRELRVLTCAEPSAHTPPERLAPGLTFSVEKPARLLPALERLAAVPRPWQRELAAQEIILPELKAVAARGEGGEIVGVCLYRDDGFRRDVTDLAADEPRTGRALAAYLLWQSPGHAVSYLNVPQDDPLLPELLQLGFQTSLSQYEMFLPLGGERPAR